MKNLLTGMALLGLLATVGCQKDAQPLVDAAEAYAKDSCACKDTACITKASKTYADATKKLAGENLVPSKEQSEKITAASTKAAGCATKMATDAAGAAMSGMPKMPAAPK